jgi:predicted RNase H-like HicB family nuclease
MKAGARYAKIVEWSDEDMCYVGSAPDLILGGCHGSDEKEVFAELCEIVDETVALYRSEGGHLPPAPAGRCFADKVEDAEPQTV